MFVLDQKRPLIVRISYTVALLLFLLLSCLLLAESIFPIIYIVAFINDLTKAHFHTVKILWYSCRTIITTYHTFDWLNASHCKQPSCLSVNRESHSLYFLSQNALQPYIRRSVSEQQHCFQYNAKPTFCHHMKLNNLHICTLLTRISTIVEA